jgi:hypothetical protein
VTHDELKRAIMERIRPDEVDADKIVLDNIDHLVQLEDALYQVVELHKPKHFILKDSEITETYCDCGTGRLTRYPCPTIQAIEKELK